jgi:hypothetical protein
VDDTSIPTPDDTSPAWYRKAVGRLQGELREARAEIVRLQQLVRGTAALRRELCMTKALGDQLDTATGRSFAYSYDGELSPEAVKDAWTALLADAIGALTADGTSLHELVDQLDAMEPTP